ncbi:cell division protein ZapA [Biformimicrobium ophioploci]|uniref:Cell division protein ZapA n=1 Tax=Biformimicrobium ophioploci TaxID=3036711 RepID=A0ABQ6M0L8_9GAMM|nr:cell division protein ZapA [Microbulbifer sp. NKW57]GMG87832.1 cell division protein ZapA [Microbulbifer sp. NKW57]
MSARANNAETVTVTILNKEYRVACAPGERLELLASAQLLNERMADIRSGGSVIGLERIAVMAALNIAHELIQSKTELARLPVEHELLDRLQEKVEQAIASHTPS